jgi:hypothetical protein
MSRTLKCRLTVECLEDRCTLSQFDPLGTPLRFDWVARPTANSGNSKEGLSLYSITKAPGGSNDPGKSSAFLICRRTGGQQPDY